MPLGTGKSAESRLDSKNSMALCFCLSALPENFDWFSCSGKGNSCISGQKPNFDAKPQKARNDSSYQSVISGQKPNFDVKPQKSRNNSSYQFERVRPMWAVPLSSITMSSPAHEGVIYANSV
jgi:hypothetical protein